MLFFTLIHVDVLILYGRYVHFLLHGLLDRDVLCCDLSVHKVGMTIFIRRFIVLLLVRVLPAAQFAIICLFAFSWHL